MSTRRRIGVSAATTEAARRQLMQPVPCFEKMWVTLENAPPGSTLRVYKWVKTEKIQQFSDDEGEDEPLAPLPDEPEAVEGDDEMEDEPPTATGPEHAPQDQPEISTQKEGLETPPSKPSSPKTQPLSMSLQSSSIHSAEHQEDDLDASLKPLDNGMDGGVDVAEKLDPGDGIELDISALGPDGLDLEGSHDLSQLDGNDAIMGGPLMDESMDPFAENV